MYDTAGKDFSDITVYGIEYETKIPCRNLESGTNELCSVKMRFFTPKIKEIEALLLGHEESASIKEFRLVEK